MINGIDHVAIYAKSFVNLRDWYIKAFGFHIVYEIENMCFLRSHAGDMLEFIQSREDGGVKGDKVSGIRHIALSTDDFEQDVERLKRLGVPVVSEPQTNPTNRSFFFRDPEGNVLQLIHRQKPLSGE